LNISLHDYITVLLKKEKGMWEYCSGLNFGAKNSKNVAVFTTGSWSCSQSATQPGRQYCHTAFVHFCRINSCLSYWNSSIVSKLEFNSRVFVM